MQIVCDSKADSTRLLTGTDRPVTVLDVMRTKGEAELEDIVREGRNGMLAKRTVGTYLHQHAHPTVSGIGTFLGPGYVSRRSR